MTNGEWEGEVVAEGKQMNIWVTQRGKSSITLGPKERLRVSEAVSQHNYLRCSEGRSRTFSRILLLLEADNIEQKPADPSGIALGDILVVWHGDALAQLLMTEWNASNVPVSLSHFSGCIYYKGHHLGGNFQELLPIGHQTTVRVNLGDQMLRKFPSYNGNSSCTHDHAVNKYIARLFL